MARTVRPHAGYGAVPLDLEEEAVTSSFASTSASTSAVPGRLVFELDDDGNDGSHINSSAVSSSAVANGSHRERDRFPENKRWSVLERLERRHYCRVRNCHDCLRILNSKSLLATLMLFVFVALAIVFFRSLLFNSVLSEEANERYDYIIVGAGPAGSVLTRKLVDRGARVLLLEAGGTTQFDLMGEDHFAGPITRFDIPLFWPTTAQFSEYHWQHFNIPGILIGKGLGGSGILNAMLYVRCMASDIAAWNLDGWTWEKVQSIYHSLEHFVPDRSESAVPYFHGSKGPVTTTRQHFADAVAPEFISAAVQSGIAYNDDFNDPERREGAGYYHFNIKGGTRQSAAREFLGPLLNRAPNLKVQLNAEVKRVLLAPYVQSRHKQKGKGKGKGKSKGVTKDQETVARQLRSNDSTPINSSDDDHEELPPYRAIGVEYLQNGVLKTAYLSENDLTIHKVFEGARCVIISAGAILSPKLLMASGIGPKEVLKAAHIETKVDSPWVGRNLQDHPALGIVVKLTPAIAAAFVSGYALANQWSEYVAAVSASRENVDFYHDFGLLGSPGISAGAFLVSPYATNGVPDLQLTLFPSMTEPHLAQPNITTASKMLITIALLNPDAQYQLVLNSSDPFDSPPLFQLPTGRLAYLSALDKRKLAWGIEQVRAIVRTQPLSQLAEEILAPLDSVEGEDALEAWVEANVYPNSHWVGSVKMGSSGDIQGSALDAKMRVHGVEGLRVADASVMPIVPNGNVHSSVLIVANMAAEFILGNLRLQ